MKSHICGTPDINCDDFIDRKQGRFMGINAKYAFIAMQQAVQHGQSAPLGSASCASCASSGRAWRLWLARRS